MSQIQECHCHANVHLAFKATETFPVCGGLQFSMRTIEYDFYLELIKNLDIETGTEFLFILCADT